VRGGLLALAATVLFGVSTPMVQRLGSGVGAFATAALFYVGAALAGALLRKRVDNEARVLPGDFPRLLAMAAAGAVIGPVTLAWGLQRTSATSASLMLTLEAVFTAVLAWRMYHETMDRRVWLAMSLLMVGGALLVLNQSRDGSTGVWGLLAVLLATAAWGLDNTLSRPLARRDPGQVVLAKAVLGALATSIMAVGFGEPLPAMNAALGLFAVGAAGYGLSLRFYLLAQRAFGAARTSSVFAFAPFIGAALAVALGDQSTSWLMVAGSALMVAGVVLHVAESHDHEHGHNATEHEHAHRHDDGHHDHGHNAMPTGAPSHRHRHEPLRHTHAWRRRVGCSRARICSCTFGAAWVDKASLRSFLGTRGALSGLLFSLLPAGAMCLGLSLQWKFAVALGLDNGQETTLNAWAALMNLTISCNAAWQGIAAEAWA
jgi:drug/metabolite transporter (DMT)-like permease